MWLVLNINFHIYCVRVYIMIKYKEIHWIINER